MRWTVLIPVKALPAAKSRLVPATADAQAHARLVSALRADTIAAARATPSVARVVVVVDDGASEFAGAEVIVQRGSGLNEAVREGAAHAAQTWPEDGVSVLVGDLPCLRPDELAATLVAATEVNSGYVADRTGTGTTLLTAQPGVGLQPQFGEGSAMRHASDATALPAGPGLRLDVDTAEDLFDALEIGVGAATLAAVAVRPAEQTSRVHLGAG